MKETIVEVDNWKEKHDENGELIEEYEVNVQMKETNEHKNIGFVISNYAKNVANILDKRNKVTGTQRNIINIVRGLGSYKFEGSIIYLKSMFKGTILNSSET